MRQRFRGRIAGVGSTSGVRVVVGRWTDTPLGAFADAMVETAAGHRVLLAPSEDVAGFIQTTYSFDEVRLEPFAVADLGASWEVRSSSLSLDLSLGGRTPLGYAVRAVPRSLAESPAWCAVTDPFARVLLRGVSTRGSAGSDRKEWYGATDVHRVVGLSGRFDDIGLGALADVTPPARFGFSSTPVKPSVTTVVTTVETTLVFPPWSPGSPGPS